MNYTQWENGWATHSLSGHVEPELDICELLNCFLALERSVENNTAEQPMKGFMKTC